MSVPPDKCCSTDALLYILGNALMELGTVKENGNNKHRTKAANRTPRQAISVELQCLTHKYGVQL